MTKTSNFGEPIKKVYGVQDVFTFGKYKGNTVEDVIHDDYGYIVWCLDNLEWFKVDEYVYELLTTTMDKYYESKRDYFEYWMPEEFGRI